MARISIKIDGLNSVGEVVHEAKEFASEDLHKLFRQFEYWYFAQRAVVAGPEVYEGGGDRRGE